MPSFYPEPSFYPITTTSSSSSISYTYGTSAYLSPVAVYPLATHASSRETGLERVAGKVDEICKLARG